MFEAILEKILQSKLGRYLNGLDEKNLKVGVWSGNVEIENVSLKPSIFEYFHLPIQLIFSYIGHISLKIPWKSLSSSPVEIIIESIFIVISPLEEQNWTFADYGKIQNRLELLAAYSNEILEKLVSREKTLENKGDDKKEASYMDKIALKVLDNLQITIKKIHLRVENKLSQNPYSFGVTLDFLTTHTTNEKWEKKFIDRTNPENENLSNYKILVLKNFSIYWNSDEKQLFCLEKQKGNIQQRMLELVKTDEKDLPTMNYLINIQAELKSIQSNGKTKYGPEFWFSLKMGNIDFSFKNKQIRDALHLLSYLNRFKKAFDQNKKITNNAAIDQEKSKALFLKYYKQWHISEKQKEAFHEKEWASFSEVISNNQLDDLCEWTKIVMKEIHKDQNFKKELERKKNSKRSFWSWGADDSQTFTTEDRKQLEELYEKNFSDKALALPSFTVKDKKYVEFEFEISLVGGSLSLILTKEKEKIERVILLSYKNFNGNIKKRENNKEIKLILNELSVVAKQTHNEKIYTQDIFNKNYFTSEKEKKNNFFELYYQENPIIEEKDLNPEEIIPDYSFDLKIGSNIIVYDPLPIKWLKKFFQVDFEDQEIVDQTLIKMNKLNADYQIVLQEKIQALPIMKINILLQAPYIMIPLNLIGRKDNPGCWFINLGKFSLFSNEIIFKKNCPLEEKAYDNYILKLEETKVLYFESGEDIRNSMIKKGHNNEKIFPIVDDIFIDIHLKKLKKSFSDLIVDKAEIQLDVVMNKVDLCVNEMLFTELLYLQNHFTEVNKKEIESKKQSRKKIEENAVIMGQISKKRRLYQVWREYFAILSQGNIYLYANKSSLSYKTIIPVYNALISQKKDNPLSFMIEKFNDTYDFSLESEAEAKKWLDLIKASQIEKEVNHEKKMIDKKNKFSAKPDQKLLDLDFRIPEIKFMIFSTNKMANNWLTFELINTNCHVMLNEYSKHLHFKISEMTLCDDLHSYKNPFLKNVFTSVNPEKHKVKELINIEIKTIDPKHQNYQNLDCEINAKFGQFFVNYKPIVIIRIPEFLRQSIGNYQKLIKKPSKLLDEEKIMQNELELKNKNKDNSQKGVVLLKMNLKWENLCVSLVHSSKYIEIFRLDLTNFDLFFTLTDEMIKIKGALNNLTLNEMSNYPNFIKNEEDYDKIQAKEIFGSANKAQNSSILDFTFTQILSQEMIKNNCDCSIDVHIHSIQSQIYMQIIMNLVDYILIDVIQALNNPKMFEGIQNNKEIIREKLVSEVIRKIKDPKFMSINVYAENLIVILKPIPNCEEFFVVNLDKIYVKNEILKSKKQILNQNKVYSKEKKPEELTELYNELYKVLLRDFSISVQRKGVPLKRISSYLEFNFVFQGICFENEYLFCYENLKLNTSICLRSLLKNSCFYLDKYDYDLLLYLTFFNLAFEGESFSANSPKSIEKVGKAKKTEIDFQLDVEEILFYGMFNEKSPENLCYPLFKIIFNNLRVKFDRVDYNDIKIFGAKMDISYYFKNEKNPRFIEELSLLSQLEIIQNYPIEYNHFLEDIKKSSINIQDQSILFSLDHFSENECQFQTRVQLPLDGSKDISVKISDIKLLIHLGFIMDLVNFALFDDSLSGPPSQKKMEENHKEKNDLLNFMLLINNVCLCIPIAANDECLATRGEIRVILQNVNKNEFGKNLEKVIDEKNMAAKMNVHLSEFEVFKCKRMDLHKSKNFKEIKKRSIFEPIQFLFNQKQYECLLFGKQKAKGLTTVLNMTNSTFKLSYKDIIELLQTANHQNELLNKAKNKQIQGFKLFNENIPKVANIEQISVEANIDVALPNVQMIIINDLGISFSPFINFSLYETQFTLKMKSIENNTSLLLETILPLSSSYYNSQINKWEPIIERINFIFDLAYDSQNKPNIVLNIENEQMTSNFNLNFSTEMLKSVVKAIKFIKESSIIKERQSVIIKNNLENEDHTDYVSPYMISNKTGYPIEIAKTQNAMKSISIQKSKIQALEKKYLIENNSSIILEEENDESFFFEDKKIELFKAFEINANILKKTVNYQPLRNINIQRIHAKEKKVYGGPRVFFVSTDVVFDAETNKKILTISSPLIIKNKTQKIINVKFQIEPEPLSLALNCDETIPVPFDVLSEKMQIKFMETLVWSSPIPLAKYFENNISNVTLISNKYINISSMNDSSFKKLLVLEPPIIIKNCLPLSLKLSLFFAVEQQTKKGNEIEMILLDPQQSYDIYDFPYDTKIDCQIEIQGFNVSKVTQINSSKAQQNLQIKIYDSKGWEQIICLKCYSSSNGARKFYFYSKAYLINETYLNLWFFTMNDKRKQMIPGQKEVKDITSKEYNDKILLLNEEKNLLVCDQSNLNEISRTISLEVLTGTLVEFYTLKGFVQMTMKMTMLCVEKEKLLYSRVISINPRYVLVNCTKFNIGVKQVDAQDIMVLSPEEKKHFIWTDYKKERYINLVVYESDSVFQNKYISWMFSSNIDISVLGSINVVIRQKGNIMIKKYIKLDIINQDGVIFIMISEYKENEAPFLIKNSLQNVSIYFKQPCSKPLNEFPYEKLDPNKASLFSWDHNLDDKILTIDFESEIYEKMKSPLALSTLNNITETYQIILLPKKQNISPLLIIIRILLQQEMKIVEFINGENLSIVEDIQVVNQKEEQKKQDQLSIKMIFKLKYVGISFIQNSVYPFNELLFVCFKGFEFIALDKNQIRTYQIRLKNFIINNNSSDLVKYPVVVAPFEKNIEANPNKFFLNLILKTHLDCQEISIYDSLRFDLDTLKIKIERTLLEKIIEYFEIITEILSKSSSSFETDLFQQHGKYIYKLNKCEKPLKFDWEIEELQKTSKQIYFKEIIIAPLFFSLNFVNQIKSEEFKMNPLSVLLNSMLSTIANLEDVKVKLIGLQLYNCSDTQEGIISKFEEHYKQNIMKELFTTLKIFNMIGHADFIGNPIGLFQNISTGVTDLWEKPKEGFVKGPLEAGKGLFEGASSLVKNTFTGTMNTFKVITGSLSSGIANLSQDKEYLQEREQMKLKEAKHVGEGLEQGAKSLFKGFEKGITGLFTKPIEETKKKGVKGLFTGTFQGVTGLFVKPISGVLDAASKTAEGVKNTALIFEKTEEKREREPRIFYGFDKCYESYNNDDIEVMKILKTAKKGKFAMSSYFGFKKYLPSAKESNNIYMLIFTLENLINFSCHRGKIEWYIPINTIMKAENQGGGLKIYLNEINKKLKVQEIWFKVDDDKILSEMREKIQYLNETKRVLDESFS